MHKTIIVTCGLHWSPITVRTLKCRKLQWAEHVRIGDTKIPYRNFGEESSQRMNNWKNKDRGGNSATDLEEVN
jgi:hypothetical protein